MCAQRSRSAHPAPTPDLIHKAIAGDRRSVRVLVDMLTPVIRARAARILLRCHLTRSRSIHQELLDLTQQVFITLFENDGRLLRAWDPARGPLAGYVGLITRRQAIASFRNQSRSSWHDELVPPEDLESRRADTGQGPERITASKEALDAVISAVRARVSGRGREIFQSLFIEECSVEEVCAETGLSADAIYAWRSRLGRLARKLGQELVSDADPSGIGVAAPARALL